MSSEDLRKKKREKEKVVANAMKQVERAMKQVDMATRGYHSGQGNGAKSGSKAEGGGIVVDSQGLFGKHMKINIQSAQNVQIGNNNVMVVNQSHRSKPKKSHKKRYDSSSSEEDIPQKTATSNPAPAAALEEDVITTSERLVNDRDIRSAVDFMAKPWRRIGRMLQLSDNELEVIYSDHFRDGGIMEVGYQVLLKWRQKSGKEATLGKLTSALCKVYPPEQVLKRFEP